MFISKEELTGLKWDCELEKENYRRLDTMYWSLRQELGAIKKHLNIEVNEVQKHLVVEAIKTQTISKGLV